MTPGTCPRCGLGPAGNHAVGCRAAASYERDRRALVNDGDRMARAIDDLMALHAVETPDAEDVSEALAGGRRAAFEWRKRRDRTRRFLEGDVPHDY